MFIKNRNGNWRAPSCLGGIISCIYRTDLSRKGKTLAKYIIHCNINLHLKINITLQWRHNGRESVSNHQPHECLLNRLFRRRSKKTSKLRVTGFVRGIHRGPVNSPHKWPVTRKMFPYDDVIITSVYLHWELFMVAALSVHIWCLPVTMERLGS